MSDEYTPTTEQVRRYWIYGCNAWLQGTASLAETADLATAEKPSEQFDRWLAQHDQEVAAKTLRDFADGIRTQETLFIGENGTSVKVTDLLRQEAARIAEGTNE